MLAKRTNILLEKTDYRLLKALAKKQSVSVGQLIREAITKTYKNSADIECAQREQLASSLRKLWQRTKAEKIDYKRLIENGRK